MKKIIILILLICSLSACNSQTNSDIYISSVGIDVNENGLVVYFIANMQRDLSRNETSTKEIEYLKIESNNIVDAFKKAKDSYIKKINFSHIKTLLLSKKFLESEFLESFLEYMKIGRDLSFNLYVYATDSNFDDVYKTKNPDGISFQYSYFLSPEEVNYKSFGLKRLHFLDFANNYYNKNRYLHIPYLVIDNSWNNTSTLKLGGYYAFSNKVNVYDLDKYPAIRFLTSQKQLTFYYQNELFSIYDYVVKKDVINGVYSFVIDYSKVIGEKVIAFKYIKEKIIEYLDSYIISEGSLFYIDFYNYTNKKALNALRYEIYFK